MFKIANEDLNIEKERDDEPALLALADLIEVHMAAQCVDTSPIRP